jgi:hypothetical protein
VRDGGGCDREIRGAEAATLCCWVAPSGAGGTDIVGTVPDVGSTRNGETGSKMEGLAVLEAAGVLSLVVKSLVLFAPSLCRFAEPALQLC